MLYDVGFRIFKLCKGIFYIVKFIIKEFEGANPKSSQVKKTTTMTTTATTIIITTSMITTTTTLFIFVLL